MARARMVDYWARAEEGERVDEKNFDLKIFWKNLKRITRKYGIRYDEQNIVPQADTDGDLLDRLFRAGRELLLETGIYCTSTNRVIKFEPWEVDETLRLIPDKVTLGSGDDRIESQYRGLNPNVPPKVLGRVLGPQSPDLIQKIFESFAKEPIIDHFHFQGVIEQVHGVYVRPNSPFEMIQEVIRTGYAKNALKSVGRPGAHDGASTPVSVRAMMVGFHPDGGKTKGDGAHVYILPSMKIDYHQMSRAYFYHLNDYSFWGAAPGFIGSLDGPPETTVVSVLAAAIAAQMLFQPKYQTMSAQRASYATLTSRDALWAGFHAAAAFIRNTRCGYVRCQPGGIITAGLGKEHFWEVAAAALGCTAIGCSAVAAGTGRQSAARDCAAGISARLAGQVGHAAVGVEPAQANDLVKRFLSTSEDQLEAGVLHKAGKNFQECYDLAKVIPNTGIVQDLDEVKTEMRALDLNVG